VSGNGDAQAAALRARLDRLDGGGEEVAKAWLIDVIRAGSLADAGTLPMDWVGREMPALVAELLAAVAGGPEAQLESTALNRVTELAELRGDIGPARAARELSLLQPALLGALRREMALSDPLLFADAAERLAFVFAQVAGASAEALMGSGAPRAAPEPVLTQVGMRRRVEQLLAQSKRYGQPFSLVMVGVEGPGTRSNGEDSKALAFAAKALRDSIRTVDDAFFVEEDELCVLAPNQTAVDGIAIAERLTAALSDLDSERGLGISFAAGVVACPEHGVEAERLLSVADTAMWRARATGRPVAVGGVQDLSQDP
jgi:diguanylate cyclase (GGDEF)-like protein